MAFYEKPPQRVDIAKISNFFLQPTVFYGFDQIFGNKLQKIWFFCEKPPKREDLAKTSNFFVQTTMF